MTGRRANIVAMVAEGPHFVATLDNGWLALGFIGVCRFDFDPSHPKFSLVSKLKPEEFKTAFDQFYRESLE